MERGGEGGGTVSDTDADDRYQPRNTSRGDARLRVVPRNIVLVSEGDAKMAGFTLPRKGVSISLPFSGVTFDLNMQQSAR